MAGDAVVYEDHSPLPLRVLVESTAAVLSALSVGKLSVEMCDRSHAAS